MSAPAPTVAASAAEVASRVQLALNVSDLSAAIEFYSKLFDAAPDKLRDGYANFAIADPPLKLVLIENAAGGGTLNHLGVEVDDTATVIAATRRLSAAGLPVRVEDGTTCCYALQDKVWASDPDRAPWEIYTVLADAATMGAASADCDCGDACYGATAESDVAMGGARAATSPI